MHVSILSKYMYLHHLCGVCTWYTQERTRMVGIKSSRISIKDSCEPSCRFWELNLDYAWTVCALWLLSHLSKPYIYNFNYIFYKHLRTQSCHCVYVRGHSGTRIMCLWTGFSGRNQSHSVIINVILCQSLPAVLDTTPVLLHWPKLLAFTMHDYLK